MHFFPLGHPSFRSPRLHLMPHSWNSGPRGPAMPKYEMHDSPAAHVLSPHRAESAAGVAVGVVVGVVVGAVSAVPPVVAELLSALPPLLSFVPGPVASTVGVPLDAEEVSGGFPP